MIAMDHVEISEPRAEDTEQRGEPVVVCSWGLGLGHSGLRRKGITLFREIGTVRANRLGDS